MKKIKKLLLILFAVLILTGCSMKMHYNIEITNDKKVTLGMLVAYDDDLLDRIISNNKGIGNKTYTNEERWNYLEKNLKNNNKYKGFHSEKYEEGKFKGYIFSSEKINIKDVTSSLRTDRFSLSDDFELLESKTWFIKEGNIYKSNIKVNESSDSKEKEYEEKLGTNLESKVIVKLPVRAISNNATNVSEDGKTLTWDLNNKGAQNIDFEFQFRGIPWLLILYIVVIITFTVLIIYFARKKLNKVEEKEEVKKIEHKEEDLS